MILSIDPGFAKDADGKPAGSACVAGAPDDLGVVRVSLAWFERPVTFAPRERRPQRSSDYYRARDAATGFDEIVIEKPQQDARSHASSPGTLIELAWVGALLAGQFAGRDGAAIVTYTPRQWKGSEAKPLMHRRMWAVLSDEEREILGGFATAQLIADACRKGGLDKWSKPGHTYYSQAKRARVGGGRGGFIHNLLDAAALLAVHTRRLETR